MIDARTEIIVFLFVGAGAAAANFGSRFLFSEIVIYELAVALAYFVGLVTGFLGFRLLVFGPSGRSAGSEAGLFLIVNIVSFVIVWGVSVALYRIVMPWIGWTWHDEAVAHGFGLATTAVTSYLMHKNLTFAGSGTKTPDNGDGDVT